MQGGGYGVLGDIVVGIIGAFVGGLIFSFLMPGSSAGLIGSIVVAFIGAVALIALVRALPDGCEVFDECALQAPRLEAPRQPAAPALMQRVHYFAEHVELQLIGGGVADAHRFRVLITGKPVNVGLAQNAFAAEAVHDLHLRGTASRRPKEPIAPRRRLVEVARIHERQQCERRVAQPAEAIVPVPLAADPFGKRRRRRGHQSTGRSIRQRLERDERSIDGVDPLAAILAFLRPLVPESLRIVERLSRVDRRVRGQVRWRVRQDEGNEVSLSDDELTDRR